MDQLRGQLHHMRVAIDMGCCRNVRWFAEQWGDVLKNSEDPKHRAEYAEILAEAEAMFEVEKVHGPGSLLKLDHPIVSSLLRKTPPSFLVSEVEAARRYQEVNEQL